MDSKITSENIVDLTTGLVSEKKATIEGKGNFGAGGQEMPMTTKVTTVTTVKKCKISCYNKSLAIFARLFSILELLPVYPHFIQKIYLFNFRLSLEIIFFV